MIRRECCEDGMKKSFKIVRIDDPEALDHIARCEVYQAISDYVIWSRILMKDPFDEDAYDMMMDCEEFIMTDPKAQRCIKDSGKLLERIDRMVEKDIRRWKKKNAANK